MNGYAAAMPGVSCERLKLMLLKRFPCSMNIKSWLWADQRAYTGVPGRTGA
jgi:hypothetical protein